MIDTFKPQEISNVIWAFATLIDKETPANCTAEVKAAVWALIVAISERADFVSQFRPQEISNTSWALAKILPWWNMYPMPNVYTNDLGVVASQ